MMLKSALFTPAGQRALQEAARTLALERQHLKEMLEVEWINNEPPEACRLKL